MTKSTWENCAAKRESNGSREKGITKNLVVGINGSGLIGCCIVQEIKRRNNNGNINMYLEIMKINIKKKKA